MLLLLLFGPFPIVIRANSELYSQESFLPVLGNHMECEGSNSGWTDARKETSCSISSVPNIIFFILLIIFIT